MKKIKINVFIPPFLEGFNVKKIKTPIHDINLEVVTTPTLKLLEKVSFENETKSETITRIVENYLLLISLTKVYQLLFYDSLQYQTTSRSEKLKPRFMERLSGMNTHFLEDLDKLIGEETEITLYHKVLRTIIKEPKDKIPTISNEIILPALSNISYENVLEKMVQDGVLPPELIKNLAPKNEFGLLAITIYKGTMQLIEAELRTLIETERLKIPPESLDELFSQMAKYATEMG